MLLTVLEVLRVHYRGRMFFSAFIDRTCEGLAFHVQTSADQSTAKMEKCVRAA